MTSVLAAIASTVPQSDAAYAAVFLGRLALAGLILVVLVKLWVQPWMVYASRQADRVIEGRGRAEARVLALRLVRWTLIAIALIGEWLAATRSPYLFGTSSWAPLVAVVLIVPYQLFVLMLW